MCIYKCERYACIFTRTYIIYIYIYVKTHFYICIQIHKSVYIHLYKVYIHIYIYLYIYICIYMNIYTHACIHVKLVPNENIRIHIDTLKCMHIPACLHMYVSKYIPASKNMYMYKYILYIYTYVMVCKIENLIIHVSDLYILMRSHRWYRCSVFVFGMVWLPNSPVLRGWKKKFEHYVNRTFPWREMGWTCDKTRFPPKQSLGLKWKHIRGMVA